MTTALYRIWDNQTNTTCSNGAFEDANHEFTLEEARDEAIRHMENWLHEDEPEYEAENQAQIEKLEKLDLTKTAKAEEEIGTILAIFDYELERV